MFSATKLNVSSAPITATPTLSSWVQTYSAGSVFALLSLSKENTQSASELNTLGKTLLDNLESEFFTLETKNLETITEAMKSAIGEIPDGIEISFSLVFIQPNEPDPILYALVYGGGNIRIKRGDAMGTIVTNDKHIVVSSSGFLEDTDVVILQTPSFTKLFSKDELKDAIGEKTVMDAAEIITPKIHANEEGAAGAVLLSYAKPHTTEIIHASPVHTEKPEVDATTTEGKEESEMIEPEDREDAYAEAPLETSHDFLFQEKNNIPRSGSRFSLNMSHSKKLFLTVAVIIAVILTVSVFFAIRKQEDAKAQALFQEVFPPAQQKYDEGQTLVSLNKNLARDDFLQAQKMLFDAQPKFAKDSTQEKQITDLLAKIKTHLDTAEAETQVQAKEASNTASKLLFYEKTNAKDGYTEDDKSIVSVDKISITSTNKTTDKVATLIKNDGKWKDPVGIGTYLGNLYLLDRGTMIYKFASGNYTKSDYLTSSFDLSKAKAMTIDGSIYVLLETGDVVKFTRGKVDTFKVSGLDTPLKNPTKIFTNADMTYLYILDNGNGRIVTLTKEGVFQAQYKAGILKDAKDMDVREKEKIVYVLSSDKIYEVPLK